MEIAWEFLPDGNLKRTTDYGTHEYSSNFFLTEFYCPECGEKGVWQEDAAGDYYVGADFVCRKCNYTFNLPNEG